MTNQSTTSTILAGVNATTIFLGNKTLNGSNSTGGESSTSMESDTFDYLTFIFCLIVIVVGVSGNVVVIMCFVSRSRKLKASGIFVIGLAIADLVGTICTPVTKMLTALQVSILPIGDFGCAFTVWISMTSVTVSAFLLVAIAFDRYLLIIRPFKPKLPKHQAIAVTVALWLMASTLGIVYFFDQRSSFYEISKGRWICALYWMSDEEGLIHTVAAFIIQMLLPCILSLIVSVLSVRELYFQRSSSLSDQNAQASACILKRNSRATRWIVTAVITFYVLVLPYNIFMLHHVVSKSHFSPTAKHIHDYLSLILLLNSCVNPVIYARLNHTYRRSLRRASFWFIGKMHRRSGFSTTTVIEDETPFGNTAV